MINAHRRGTDLRGADLRQADLAGTDLTGAQYVRRTRWPAGLDPRWRGAVRVR